ncbi:6,7-dimethyl-8-ribityllumazine synthase, partial [Microthyrium microscopicum]
MAPAGANKPKVYDGSGLRIGIVHARWNSTIIDALVAGAKKSLKAAGVVEDNIIVQSVAGSWELPMATQRMYAASQSQSSSSSLLQTTTDLLASTSFTDLSKAPGASAKGSGSSAPFDAIISIGVLVKGETMHFEYIADSVVHGLMKVQLDTGFPVVLGLLTVLNEKQGEARAGLTPDGHNHGEDWGLAAVEMGFKGKAWAKGEMV